MSNSALRDYLHGYFRALGRKPTGRRYGFQDLIETKALSRTTLYNWLGGAPGNADSTDRLVLGLVQLAAEAPASDRAALKSEDELKRELQRLLISPDTWAEFKAFSYLPVSGPKGPGISTWSFLGTIVERFLQASGRDQEQVTLIECDVDELDLPNEDAVLVGFFAMPDRMAEWDYIRTPINIPLNAVALQRDLIKVLPSRDKRTDASLDDLLDDYLSGLRAALWQTHTGNTEELPRINGELRPVTAVAEAGRTYIVHAHRFREEQLAPDEPSSPSPSRFLLKLESISNKLEQAASAKEQLDVPPKLPIVVADELTCFRLLQEFPQAPVAKHTAARLLSLPAAEADDLLFAHRPTYSVSLAVRRERSALSSAGLNSFDATRRSFEEFIRTNAAMVAHQYVRLYSELVSTFESNSIVGPCAALYFLRWLSIVVTRSDVDVAETGHQPSVFGCSDSHIIAMGIGVWRDVLYTAKGMILRDPILRAKLQTAFALYSERHPTETTASP